MRPPTAIDLLGLCGGSLRSGVLCNLSGIGEVDIINHQRIAVVDNTHFRIVFYGNINGFLVG